MKFFIALTLFLSITSVALSVKTPAKKFIRGVARRYELVSFNRAGLNKTFTRALKQGHEQVVLDQKLKGQWTVSELCARCTTDYFYSIGFSDWFSPFADHHLTWHDHHAHQCHHSCQHHKCSKAAQKVDAKIDLIIKKDQYTFATQKIEVG